MKFAHAREGFARGESGFTLPEMMVTIAVMMVMFFALYSIFDMSIRIFTFGNDKVEAVQNARLGLEKMEREIRAAYPTNRNDEDQNNKYLFFSASGVSPDPPKAMPTATQITFGNQLGGTAKIECGSPCEYITYRLTDANGAFPCNAAPCQLRRINASTVSSGAGEPVVEFVASNGLTFTYLKEDGSAFTPAELSDVDNEQFITAVRVQLTVNKDGRTQTLITDVHLRNRES